MPKTKIKTSVHNTIAFQGEPGANSQMACHEAFPKMQTLPCATFEDAFAAVTRARKAGPDGEARQAHDALVVLTRGERGDLVWVAHRKNVGERAAARRRARSALRDRAAEGS